MNNPRAARGAACLRLERGLALARPHHPARIQGFFSPKRLGGAFAQVLGGFGRQKKRSFRNRSGGRRAKTRHSGTSRLRTSERTIKGFAGGTDGKCPLERSARSGEIFKTARGAAPTMPEAACIFCRPRRMGDRSSLGMAGDCFVQNRGRSGRKGGLSGHGPDVAVRPRGEVGGRRRRRPLIRPKNTARGHR